MEETSDFLFVHAIGNRAGAEAWPVQADLPGARFVVRRGFGDDEPPARFTVDDEAAWLGTTRAGRLRGGGPGNR